MSPRISVLLSVYNGEKYVKQAVESILRQSFEDFELVIINDGSIDETKTILDEFTDPRIVRLENEKNIGLVQSLNKGLKIVKGEFIARMDADDESVTDRFAKQIAYLNQHPDVGVLGTWMTQIGVHGEALSVFKAPVFHRDILLKMLSGTAIAHATVLMRRSILLEAGGYDESFRHVEDTELWTRLILKTRFANLPEALYIRRLHHNSIMSKYSDFQTKQSRVLREHLLLNLINEKVLNDEEIKKASEFIKIENSFLKKVFNSLKNLLPVAFRHRLRSYFHNIFSR